MRGQFQYVLDNYLKERQNKYEKNYVADYIRHALLDNISKSVSISDQYLIKGSATLKYNFLNELLLYQVRKSKMILILN